MLSNIVRTTRLVRAAKLVTLPSTRATPVRAYSTGQNRTDVFNELQSHLDRLDKEVKNLSSIGNSQSSNINDIVKQLQKSTSSLQTSQITKDDIREIIHDEVIVIKFISQITCGVILGCAIGRTLGTIL